LLSPTARTLTLLRRQGFLAAPVERFIPQVQRKQDLFGVAGFGGPPGPVPAAWRAGGLAACRG